MSRHSPGILHYYLLRIYCHRGWWDISSSDSSALWFFCMLVSGLIMPENTGILRPMRNKIRVFPGNAWTQEQLAKAIGVNRQTIIAIENERYVPSLNPAFKISRYFGVNIEDVFTFEENVPAITDTWGWLFINLFYPFKRSPHGRMPLPVLLPAGEYQQSTLSMDHNMQSMSNNMLGRYNNMSFMKYF